MAGRPHSHSPDDWPKEMRGSLIDEGLQAYKQLVTEDEDTPSDLCLNYWLISLDTQIHRHQVFAAERRIEQLKPHGKRLNKRFDKKLEQRILRVGMLNGSIKTPPDYVPRTASPPLKSTCSAAIWHTWSGHWTLPKSTERPPRPLHSRQCRHNPRGPRRAAFVISHTNNRSWTRASIAITASCACALPSSIIAGPRPLIPSNSSTLKKPGGLPRKWTAAYLTTGNRWPPGTGNNSLNKGRLATWQLPCS